MEKEDKVYNIISSKCSWNPFLNDIFIVTFDHHLVEVFDDTFHMGIKIHTIEPKSLINHEITDVTGNSFFIFDGMSKPTNSMIYDYELLKHDIITLHSPILYDDEYGNHIDCSVGGFIFNIGGGG